MSEYETIRLPMRQEDGTTVHRTLQGEWLVGVGDLRYDASGRCPWVGPECSYEERKQWGWGHWFVIRSASGKLVVYQPPRRHDAATIAIYDSFEAMQPHVPPSIYDDAMKKAGLTEPERFTELPLE